MFGSIEFRVGLLVVLVSVMVAGMTLSVNEDPSYLGGSKLYWFHIDDASGLVEKSSIKIAGINVGIIRKIRLVDGVARVELSFGSDITLTESAGVEVRSAGILGDKFVSVTPGNSSDPEMKEGSEIKNVSDRGSMDKVVKQVGELAQSLSEVAKTLKDAVKGNEEQVKTSLGRIIRNFEVLTENIASITEQNKGKINNIIDDVEKVAATIDELVNDESDEGLRANWRKAVVALGKIDTSLANIEEITHKVNSGEGTLGRLINDEETVEEINTAVAGINEFIGGANKIQTSIDVHTEYLSEQSLAKTYAGIRIQPGLDRYFEIAVIDDPKGVVETTETEKTVKSGGSSTSSETEEVKTFKNKTKLTLIFAKNFWDFTIRGGLIESSGGLGLDYHMFGRKLRFSVEAFEFGDDNPHMRGYARYSFMRGLYLIGGADDFISTDGTFSSFIGAGIDLTNDDIKKLATQVPF